MKISVVIPAYNEEKYIGRTLDSIKKLELSGNELELRRLPRSMEQLFITNLIKASDLPVNTD